MRIEAQRQLVKDDPHAVPRFRVLGSLSNLSEFEQAFSCKAGAPMCSSKIEWPGSDLAIRSRPVFCYTRMPLPPPARTLTLIFMYSPPFAFSL
jgi:hypothetical protein